MSKLLTEKKHLKRIFFTNISQKVKNNLTNCADQIRQKKTTNKLVTAHIVYACKIQFTSRQKITERKTSSKSVTCLTFLKRTLLFLNN